MDSAQTKLKIKIKSLGEEARIIKREERKALQAGRWAKAHEEPDQVKNLYGLYESLHSHRTSPWELRGEARATLIAYAFLRNKPFTDIPLRDRPRPPYAKAAGVIKRFAPTRYDEFLAQANALKVEEPAEVEV